MQLVVAVNPNEMFNLQDARGISRYELIAQVLQNWASSKPVPAPDAQPTGQDDTGQTDHYDDLSFITSNGTEITHISSYAEWLKSFQSFNPEQETKLNFDVLVKSIDIALDKTPRDGMGRAILLITAPPGKDDAIAFDNLISRANEQQVHVFIWMISSPGYFSSQGAIGLSDLATKTGGEIFMFSGQETIPNPDEYFAPLRDTYLITYESHIRNNGDHKLVVEVRTPGQIFSSETRSFYITLAPPQPMFVSPPREIIRIIQVEPPSSNESAQNSADKTAPKILPEHYPLKILVDFPDGFRRNLKHSALYVDGQIAAENKEPPFDQFDWDLTKHPGGGDHFLQIEVVDQLDLNNVSVETPIRIKIQSQKQSLSNVLAQQGKIIAFVAVALAGILLLWALVLGGRLHPRTFFLETRQKISNHRYLDPVTQPVLIKTEPVTRPRIMSVETNSQPLSSTSAPTKDDEITAQSSIANIYSRISEYETRFNYPWQTRREDTQERAYLIRLIDVPGTNEPMEDSKPFTVIAKEVVIGSNPLKASLVIEDPSVDGIHARLLRLEDGTFVIADLGSTAGTWVNYAPISKEGTILEHGDLLHIGRVGFRFARSVSVKPPKRTIITQRVTRN
jgi:hypothetical protein